MWLHIIYMSFLTQEFAIIRGMMIKIWFWCNISVTSSATCLKIVPNNNILFVYTLLWHVVCNLKERLDIYPKTAMHLNALTYQVDYACLRHHNLDKSSLSISFLWLLSVHSLANMFWRYGQFLYDLSFLGPLMYGYATVSYNLTFDNLKFWPALTAITTGVLKVKIV